VETVGLHPPVSGPELEVLQDAPEHPSSRQLPGEHNEYVLGSLLGMTEDEIAQLEAERIIGKEYLPGSDQ
jgi:crotonobetainyl-CoA:carnitine CoA-transferase CaiB-like acyl-CoA transferase